jgi:hypothetical protein
MLTIPGYCGGGREPGQLSQIGHGMDGWGSIPGRGKILHSSASRPAQGFTNPPFQWVSEVLFLGHKAVQSHASSAGVNNDGTALPFPACLHGIMFN